MSEGGIVRMRDDVWTIRAAALLAVGLLFIAVGLVPSVGLSLAAIGAIFVGVGVAIFARGVGLDIEPGASRLVLRHLANSQEIGFSHVSYVGIEPSRPDAPTIGWTFLGGQRFDVVINVRGADPTIVRRDLTIEAARKTARQLRQLTGSAGSEHPIGIDIRVDNDSKSGGTDARL